MQLNKSGKTIDEVVWDTPILDEDRLEMRRNAFPTFELVEENDETSALEDWCRHRIQRRTANVVLELVGRTGDGKSYSMLSLIAFVMSLHGKDVSREDIVNKLCFDIEEALEAKEHLDSPGDFIARDEVPYEGGVGAMRQQQEWGNLAETIRKKQVHLFLATPTRKPLSVSMWVLEPIRMSSEDEVVLLALATNERRFLGHVIISHPKEFISEEAIQEYERIKNEFLNEIEGREAGGHIDEMAEELIEEYGLRLMRRGDSLWKFAVERDGELEELNNSDVEELAVELHPVLGNRGNELDNVVSSAKAKLKSQELGLAD